MKIIYCANARIPTQKAHGLQICKMCEQLGKAGAEVELWHAQRKNPITKNVFEYYALDKSFSTKVIPTFDFIAFAHVLGSFAMWLQRIVFYFYIKKLLKKEKGVIFTRDPEVVYAAKKTNHFVLYENHDGLSKHPKLQLKLIAEADRIITTNRYIQQQFVDYGVDKEKITILPHGVDFAAFDIAMTKHQALDALDVTQEKKQMLSEKEVLVYTGNFTTMNQDKGIADILHALQQLPEHVVFVAVGGNEKDIITYTAMAENLGVADRVLFVGRQSQKQLGVWQKIATILLMPFPDAAHYREHMAPLKMFEYLVSKRPIIASDLPSIRAVLSDESAYFCQPSNPDDLARVINQVLASNTSRVTDAAYAKAQEYRWDMRAKKIISLIQQ